MEENTQLTRGVDLCYSKQRLSLTNLRTIYSKYNNKADSILLQSYVPLCEMTDIILIKRVFLSIASFQAAVANSCSC